MAIWQAIGKHRDYKRGRHRAGNGGVCRCARIRMRQACWRSLEGTDIRSFSGAGRGERASGLGTGVRFGRADACRSSGRSSVPGGSPARSRMSMSFPSRPSMAGRRRKTLLSFRMSRPAASSSRRMSVTPVAGHTQTPPETGIIAAPEPQAPGPAPNRPPPGRRSPASHR